MDADDVAEQAKVEMDKMKQLAKEAVRSKLSGKTAGQVLPDTLQAKKKARRTVDAIA